MKFVACVMWIVSKVYTYNLSLHLHSIRDIIYTMWIRNFIGHVGENSRVAYPCSLQGGGEKHIIIGDHTNIQGYCIIGCHVTYLGQKYSPTIKIGDNCKIGEYCHITSCNNIIIGDGLLTGRFVTITDNAHGGLNEQESVVPPYERRLQSKGEVILGRNVWIGDKVTILPNVHIGNNVIIAANAVVSSDVPDNSVVAGIPARIVRKMEK